MEGGVEGGGFGIKNRNTQTGEVDYKSKSGTAWSHSYLNQKPWHPLSYPNQRRKWIAEQSHATRQRHAEEVAREYAQEQDFFRQTALVSSKEKEKLEIMKAVSFMYVRPPGYNAESAKAAELADADSKDVVLAPPPQPQKTKAKDVFGRSLPTEDEFEVLKNAPRLETGVAGRVKPFGVEIRNVKCLRCGAYGHQSGDRECPLRDAIMPNEETRLRRDDPLTAILVHTNPTEPLKWELKQKPGISPPRGGFKPDDPNQQIVAEDIFDEYGGFLIEGNIPKLLTNFSSKPKKESRKKSTHRNQQSSPNVEFEDESSSFSSSSMEAERRSQKRKCKKNKKKRKKKHKYSASSCSDVAESYMRGRSKNKHCCLEESDKSQRDASSKNRKMHSYSSEDSDDQRDHRRMRSRNSKTDDRHYYDTRHKHSSYSSSKGKEKCRSHQHSDIERQHCQSKQKSGRATDSSA